MSPSRAVRLSAAFAALLALSLGPKVTAGGKRLPDERALVGELRARLDASGFAVRVHPDDPGALVASRGSCRLIARSGDEGAIRRRVFDRDAEGVGPVRYGYRGRWMAEPVGMRPYFERVAQGQLAILGIRVARPAVLALAQSAACPDLQGGLNDLVIQAKRNSEAEAG